MKPRVPGCLGIKLAFLSTVLAANLVLCVTGVNGQIAFSAGVEIQSRADFYGPLTSYGNWYDLPAYGRCWHPAQIEAGWRPYAVGHLEWADCGWYWVSH